MPSLERTYSVSLRSVGSCEGLVGGAGDRLSVYSSLGSCSPGHVVSAGATDSVFGRALDKPQPTGTAALGTTVGTFGSHESVRKGTHDSQCVRNSRKGARSNRRKGLAKAYFTSGAWTVRELQQLRDSNYTSVCTGQGRVPSGEQDGASILEQAADMDSVLTWDVGSGVTAVADSELTRSVGSATAHAAHGLVLLQFAAHSGAGNMDLVDTDSDELADTACSAYTVCAACSAVVGPFGGPVGVEEPFVGQAAGMALPGASGDAPGSQAVVLGCSSDLLVARSAGRVVGAETGAGLLAANWREFYFDPQYQKPTASIIPDARCVAADAGADVLGHFVSPYAMCMWPLGAAAVQAGHAGAGTSTELSACSGAGTRSCTPIDLVSVLKPAAGIEYLAWNDLAGSGVAQQLVLALLPSLS